MPCSVRRPWVMEPVDNKMAVILVVLSPHSIFVTGWHPRDSRVPSGGFEDGVHGICCALPRLGRGAVAAIWMTVAGNKRQPRVLGVPLVATRSRRGAPQACAKRIGAA